MARQLELRVGGDESQQFAAPRARAAEQDGWYAVQGLLAEGGDAGARAKAHRLDDRIPERRRIADRVAGRHFQLLLDNVDADLVVGGRPGHHARLDVEALA